MATTDSRGPIAKKVDHEVVFGYVEGENRGPNPMNPPIRCNDPYFWLRDDARKDPEVIAHLKQENAFFEERTADIRDLSETIYNEHISHIQETDMSAPYPSGDFLYYSRDVKGLSYKIHCRVKKGRTPGAEGDEEVILDENKIAEGKSFCVVHAVKPAPPLHQRIAYSLDSTGNEVYSIQFLEGDAAKDVVTDTNGEIVWGMDETSFFYTTKDAALRDNKIWRHIVGEPQEKDVCLYTDDDELFNVFVSKSSDGLTLFIGSQSSETAEVYLLDLRRGNSHCTLELVRAREKGVRYSVEMHGPDSLIVLTNKDGCMNNKLVLANRTTPSVWDVVLVEHSEERFVDEVSVFKTFLVAEGREGGLTRIWTIVAPEGASEASGASVFVGQTLRELVMPEPVFTVAVACSQNKEFNATTFRMTYSSMTTPTTWLDVSPETHEMKPVKVREVGGGFCAGDYVCQRRFATAPDRTKIAMSIVYKKGLDVTKPQPTMLYGYGSYGICIDPEFSIKYLPFVDRGMIYAIAHIRGGGEMGRAWYEVGAKYLTKRNTFSDFIACAEYLIEQNMTSPDLLACEGRSAGGLLVGAVLNMRPDLFKAAVAGVPFVDVMTTMCDPSIPLTTGEWEEWGNPNEYKYYDYMNSYSPMNNVRAQAYPNIFIQAGLHDPRVAFWEPAKWASKLRELKTDNNEVLLKMDMDTGHFSASDRYKYWRESAIQQAFVIKHVVRRALKK